LNGGTAQTAFAIVQYEVLTGRNGSLRRIETHRETAIPGLYSAGLVDLAIARFCHAAQWAAAQFFRQAVDPMGRSGIKTG
jgi:hypothetical protein